MTTETRTWKPDYLSVADFSGVTMPSVPEGRGGFLDDVIVDLGFADRDKVNAAVSDARLYGKLAARTLVDDGTITEDQLARAIAERNGLPFVDLDRFQIGRGMEHLIGRTEALRYHALPIAFVEYGALVVALADPLDTLAVADIAVMTKSELLPVVASAAQIDKRAERLGERMPAPRPVKSPPLAFGDDAEGETIDEELPELGTDELLMPSSDIVATPRIESLGPPAEPTPHLTDTTLNLRDRIVDLVEAALDETAGTEIGRLEATIKRLEAELATERRERDELKALRDDERRSREDIATALETAAQELERSEAELLAARGEHDADRTQRADEIDRLRTRLAKAASRADQLEKMLEEIVGTVNNAHEASQRLTGLHGKLQSSIDAE